jgi:hypothetical protein
MGHGNLTENLASLNTNPRKERNNSPSAGGPGFSWRFCWDLAEMGIAASRFKGAAKFFCPPHPW